MVVGDLSVFVLDMRAVLAVDLIGGVIPCAVECDQPGVVNAAEGIENALLFECLINAVVHGKQRLGLDRIEHVANVVVGGGLFDLEKGLCVTLPLILLHGFLVGQERWALSKEHREGAQSDRFHAVLGVASGALVVETGEARAKFSNELIEAFEAHEQSLPRKSALSG